MFAIAPGLKYRIFRDSPNACIGSNVGTKKT